MKRGAVTRDVPRPDEPPAGRRTRAALLVILALALCLRAAFLLSVKDTPLFRNPIIDAKEYVEWAQRITGGETLWSEVQLHGPVYPYFLAAVFRIFGAGVLAPAIIQCVLGCVNCLLTGLIAGRALGRTVGLVACAVAGCSWMLMFYELNLLSVTLEILLNLLALWLVIEAQDRQSLGLLCCAGASLGLSALTRPTILLFAAAWTIWLAIQRRPAPAAAICWAGAFLLSVLLPIAPVAARNYALSGEFVPIQKNSGLNFFLGNGHDMNGFPSVLPGVDYDALLKAPERAGFTGLRRHDAFYYGKAAQFAAAHPAQFALLQLRKLVLFFGAVEICPSSDIDYFRKHSVLPWRLFMPQGLIAPFALAWMVVARKRGAGAAEQNGDALTAVVVFLVCVLAGCVLFVTCSRYRMSAVPVLCMFAAAGGVGLAKALARRDVKGAAQCLAAVGVAALFVNVDWAGARGTRLVRTEFQLGRVEANAGRPAAAIPHFEAQLRETPDDPDVRRDLAVALMTLGEYTRAEQHLVTATTLRPAFAEAWESLGRARLLAGRPKESLESFETARRLDPEYWRAQAGAGLALMTLGRLDEAVAAYRDGLRVNPASAAMHLEIGSAYGALGKLDLAEVHLARSVELDASNPEAQLRLATCYFAEGKMDLARRRALAAKSLGHKSADDLLEKLGAGNR